MNAKEARSVGSAVEDSADSVALVLDEDAGISTTADGTEAEETGITRPFNPTLINIQTRQMSLDTLIERMRQGNEVDLAPDFQRGEVWGEDARSRLIESILIRIPLPAFYMDATDDEHWVVVDGLQRLATLRDFVIRKTMKLRGLEFLEQFKGAGYDDLPRNYQRRIEETQVTVYLIEKGTPAEVKFNIFKRINTGGLPLTAQEIRHALNQGPVTELLKRLARSTEFAKATDDSVSDARMVARECVLRFLAFILTDPQAYEATDFDAFLSDKMAMINKMTTQERERLEARFYRALKAAHDIFGLAAFRKPKRQNRSPVNKALFEVWTVTMDSLDDNQITRLRNARDVAARKIDDFMRRDPEFIEAISQATGDKAKVRLRFAWFKKALLEALP